MPNEGTGTMNPQVSVSQTTLTAFCQEHGIRRLAVFGSALRDDFGPDSDIDLLVEFEPDRIPGLLGVAGMEVTLSETLRGAESRPAHSRGSESILPSGSPGQGRSAVCAGMMKSVCAICSKPRVRPCLSRAAGCGEDLETDRQLLLSLVKDIEIVGEAASQITDSTRKELAAIP